MGDGKSNVTGKWSFALINDIHLGCYYPEYGADGYEDGPAGQEYFLTERLRRTVRWINDNKDDPALNIKFVVVNGDITESAEESEFYKAREVLEDLDILYLPIFGNHDAWPYCGRSRAPGPTGSAVFNRIFSGAFESVAGSPLVTGWEKDTRTVAGTPLNNYAFTLGGVRFIALDLVCRESTAGPGVDGRGVLHPGTRQWLAGHLDGKGEEPVVLLSHHPLSNLLRKPKGFHEPEWLLIKAVLASAMVSDGDRKEIEGCLEGRTGVRAAFAGHIHSAELLIGHMPTPPFIWDSNETDFEPPGGVPVVLTEAVVAGSNGTGGQDKGTIRIASVSPDGRLDYATVAGPESPACNHALNPSFDVNHVGDSFIFVPHRFTRQATRFRFDFGDGTSSGDFEAFDTPWWDRVNLVDSKLHTYHDGHAAHNVRLRVREQIASNRYFTEEIARQAGP